MTERAELKFTLTSNGALFVTHTGATRRPVSFVKTSVILGKFYIQFTIFVSIKVCTCILHRILTSVEYDVFLNITTI